MKLSSKEKKKVQLGMDPGTASARLLKDIMWSLLIKQGLDSCCKCGRKMTRETFSVEHKVPWLDSENPAELFFSLDNIGFSHLKCNIQDRRVYRATHHECGTYRKYKNGCKCDLCTAANSAENRKRYDPVVRKKRFVDTGH